MKSVKLALVGATGAVGEAVVEYLQKRDFPVETLHLLASARTAGTSLMFNGKPIMVKDLKDFDFAAVTMAIFVATDEVSSEFLPLAQSAGCLVIDNSQAFADTAPIIVPGVNDELLTAKPPLVVNPDSCAISLATLLKPLSDELGIDRVNVTACQSVSGHGKKAIHELASQTASLLNGRNAEKSVYPQQIAFNLLPYVGEIGADGHCEAEKRIVSQTRRLLGDEQLSVNVTCIQAPIFYADSLVVNFDTKADAELETVRNILENAKGINVLDDGVVKSLATPVTHATGSESMLIGRIRRDLSHHRGINLWLTSDNVRKSAAINTILIAEELIKSYL